MKIISWNCNSIRKGIMNELYEVIESEDPDIICFQETKGKGEDIEKYLKDYEIVTQTYKYRYYNDSTKGQAGVCLFSKVEPISVEYTIPGMFFLSDGRIIIANFKDFILLNTYVPNTGRGVIAENMRMTWHTSIMEWLIKNITKSFLVWCGDLNVVREPSLDTTHHKARKIGKNLAGLKHFEKEHLDEYFKLGLVDTFRELHPNQRSYTFFSNFSTETNIIGWRLDYFLVNDISKVKDIKINNKLHKMISDHTWMKMVF